MIDDVFDNQNRHFYWIFYLFIIVVSLVLALTSVMGHPLLPIIIVLGCVVLFVSIKSPFALLIFFVVFLMARIADFAPFLGAIGAGKILSFAALGVFFFSKMLKRDFSIVRSKIGLWFAFFCIGLLISSVFGTFPSQSIGMLTEDFIKTIIMFFLIVNVTVTNKQIYIFQICIAVLCTFIGWYCFTSQIIGMDFLTGQPLIEGTRSAFVNTDPNDTALAILIATPFIIYAFIETRGIRRILFFTMLFFVIAGILATQSRGGLIGLSVVVAIIFSRYVRNKFMVVGVVVAILFTLYAAANISKRESGGAHEAGIDESAQGRLDAWHAGGRMLLRNPLTGVGFCQFSNNSSFYMVNTSYKRNIVTHNSYIQVASETGLVGLIPFLAFVFLMLQGSFRISKSVSCRPANFLEIVKASIFPSLVSTLTCAIFLSVAYYVVVYVQFAFIAACVSIFREKKTDVCYNADI